MDDARALRLGRLAGAIGMVCWVVGTVLIPLDARIEYGPERLADVVADHSLRLRAASLLAIAGAVLLVVLFVVLAELAQGGARRWLSLSVALCVVTMTLVAAGGAFGLVTVHVAVAGATPALVEAGWAGLWLCFVASDLPTVGFTLAAVAGMRSAGLSPRWVDAIGVVSAAAHALMLLTLARTGIWSVGGLVAQLVPVTTVVWILCVAAVVRGPIRIGR